MTEHCQNMKYRFEGTTKNRLHQPALGSDDRAPGKQPEESPALHPAIGLLIALGASTLFWAAAIGLIVWWVR